MRIFIPCVILALVGCGTSGSGLPALGSAALSGNVYQLDGQTLDRSGVTVQIAETGQRTVTGADGTFRFADVPTGAVTLLFGRSAAQLAASGDAGADDGTDDGTEDGVDDGTDDGTEDGTEDETEDEVEEDDDGNPVLQGLSSGDAVQVRAALQGNTVVEFSQQRGDALLAMAQLDRAATSPDADVEGRVKIQSRPDGEKFTVEADHLAAGDIIEVFVSGTSAGTAMADATGHAQFERNTKNGDVLPLGVATVAELSGLAVEVRLSGATLLTGVIPDLPSTTPIGGAGDGRGRGAASLISEVAGVEGSVQIRSRPDNNEQRFKMEAEGLLPGEVVTFQIENPAVAGSFLDLATVAADGEGDAEVSTQDGLALPAGVSLVSQLVGLQVRVVSGGTVLLSGTVPALVAD